MKLWLSWLVIIINVQSNAIKNERKKKPSTVNIYELLI